jgi:hypothetical protein
MLAKIKELVFQGYFINKKGVKFTLVETAKRAACKEAKFEAKHDYIIFKFDQSVQKNHTKIEYIFPFYNDGNANAMCDYIIFYQKNDHDIFAVICNLKSQNKQNNDDQMNAGEIFSKFIFDTANRLHKESFHKINLSITKVLFSYKRLYPNNKNNKRGVINLLSNDEVIEPFVFENWCHKK